jgi:hypothetical protein
MKAAGKRLELDIKPLITSAATSLLIMFAAFALFEFFRHPLSRSDLDSKMLSRHVIYFLEHDGVLAFETKNSGVCVPAETAKYKAYIFVESMIFSRFRLYNAGAHNFMQNSSTAFIVPGKRHYVAISFGGGYITFPPEGTFGENDIHRPRIGYRQIGSFVSYVVMFNFLIYFIILRRKRKDKP